MIGCLVWNMLILRSQEYRRKVNNDTELVLEVCRAENTKKCSCSQGLHFAFGWGRGWREL